MPNKINRIDSETAKKLLDAAKAVSKNTYSPYSKFPVGAALLTKKGSIYTGTNIENASYGGTICAERFAIGNSVSHGEKQIIAIAVYAPKNPEITPCGMCRQFIIEFGKDIIVIHEEKGNIVQTEINKLLPQSFTKSNLK